MKKKGEAIFICITIFANHHRKNDLFTNKNRNQQMNLFYFILNIYVRREKKQDKHLILK